VPPLIRSYRKLSVLFGLLMLSVFVMAACNSASAVPTPDIQASVDARVAEELQMQAKVDAALPTALEAVATPTPAPVTVPTAPRKVSATASNAQAVVTWIAPVTDGGSPISTYTITASPSGATASWFTGPLTATVTGLTNGIPYTFTVTASNFPGKSRASSASSAVIPKTLPGAPTNVSATWGDAQAVVTWTPPASNGGSAITAYTITTSPGSATASWSSGALTATVTGLTNGTAYSFTVTATTALTTGPVSLASSTVTPAIPLSAPTNVSATTGNAQAVVTWTPPGAPTNVSAIAGNTQAIVTWSAPASDGGAAITGYSVIASPGGATARWSSGTLAATVTGLENGTAYTFKVAATHSAGASAASFRETIDFTTGNAPRFVALGDINNDGNSDIVSSNYGSNTVSVLLGDGAGSFGEKTDSAASSEPRFVALGDLNNDGHPDIVVTGTGSNTVSVLLGDGAGSFGEKTDSAAGAAPYFVALGDLNNDGHTDIVVTSHLAISNTVSVLLNAVGTGAWSSASNTLTLTALGAPEYLGNRQ
jgi:hypothetical protein